MLSTDNNEHGGLEQRLQQRFQDAEATPGPDVWSRIDYDLAMLENKRYKKRALFYRQLAAACFILFILSGAALLLHFRQDTNHDLVAHANEANPQNQAASQPATETIAFNQAEDQSLVESEAGSVKSRAANSSIIADAGSSENTSIINTDLTIQKPANTPAKTETGSRSVNNKKADHTQQYSGTIAAVQQNQQVNPESVLENKEQSITAVYMPASQAIANVPDSYTSPESLNPLLLRNATLGTIGSTATTPQSIALEKPENVLAAATEQEKEEGTKENSRWNVGLGYASTYFTQNVNIPRQMITSMVIRRIDGTPPPGPTISGESEENLRDAYTEFYDNTEAALSFNIDAKAGFRIGKRFKILSGLGYSQNTSRTRTSYVVEQFLVNPVTNERVKLQPTTIFLPSLHTFTTDSISVIKTDPFSVDYSYQMLSVPLGAQVEGNLGKQWFWYANGSMAANFLIQSSIKSARAEVASVTYGPTDDSPFRKVQFSGNVGFGFGKRLSDALQVSFGPEYRSYFKTMLTDDKAAVSQGKPYTIGVNMGISYTLGK